MTPKKRKLLGGFNRFLARLTLGVAVLLPAAGLIFLNFHQLRSFERDKVLEATINRDFHEVLAISEKQINHKIYEVLEDARQRYPSPDDSTAEKEKKLDLILSKAPLFSHIALFDEKESVVRYQPSQMSLRSDSEKESKAPQPWLKTEGKSTLMQARKKNQPYMFYSGSTKRPEGEVYLTTAFFPIPGVEKDRVVLGTATLDPYYLKQTFFP